MVYEGDARIEPDFHLAGELFDTLRQQSSDGVGVTRDSYGEGEQRAHHSVAALAATLGLEVRRDAALNLYMTLPGRDRQAPVRMTGSHLDSVPRGGNSEGAAGVVAGLAILPAWRSRGYVPATDVTVMAIRAEESAWFPVSYIGSKAAFGKLPAAALDAMRQDDSGTLDRHIETSGGDLGRIRAGESHLDPRRIDRFVELHIEQGPVLVEAGEAVGIVTGICGSLRYRSACGLGAYMHSGATPRSHRRDAVVAVSALVLAMHEAWTALEEEGHELTVTTGRMATDPKQADFSKVAGRVDFCIDLRSRSADTLLEMERRTFAAVARISERFDVAFDLGPRTLTDAGAMDQDLRTQLHAEASALGMHCREMPSGAGHDAAMFAGMGVPTAMIFVRNAHGSHNPDEAMTMDDFAQACRLLEALLRG